jgi:hypothetical protein
MLRDPHRPASIAFRFTSPAGTAREADVRVSCAPPRDGGALIASPQGYVLLSPLPEERWITFSGDLDSDESASATPSAPRCAASTTTWCCPDRQTKRAWSESAIAGAL